MIAMSLHWWQWMFGGSAAWREAARPDVRDELLRRARCAIREGELEMAEGLVMEYGEAALFDAACLNTLGLICEARGRWANARRFWGKAVRADRRCDAARTNLRRYYELFQWGRTDWPPAFGDETAFDLLRGRRIRCGH